MPSVDVRRLVEDFVRDPATESIAKANLMNKDEAEDAVQEAAMLALEHLPDDHPNPIGWLRLTLKRKCWCINHAKRQTEVHDSKNLVGAATIEPSPQGQADVLGLREAIREGMGELKADERDALTRQALGFSYAEIAAELGWTYTKTNRCLTEGRQALRRHVAV